MKSYTLLTTQRALIVIFVCALALALIPAITNAAPAAQTNQLIYIVRHGDTLFSIAQHFRITVPALMTANNLTTDYIYVGQRLVIPTTPMPTVTPPPDFTCKYTVVSKDTIYSIGYRYNKTPWYLLMQANFLYAPYIRVGQILNVPCITPEPAPFPTYTVATSDTLYSLAVRYETSVYAIALVNRIPNVNLIFVGQNLIIPYTGTVKYPPTLIPGPLTPTPTLIPGQPTLTPTPTTTTGAPAVIIMQNVRFLPNTYTVRVGELVTWRNQDTLAHTVTSGTPGNLTGFFRSQQLAPGDVFTYTFTTPGTYPYFCEIHGAQMTGTITVQ